MKYLAITIGPVFDAIRQARKTRELWAASYLFSQLMEELVAQISARGATIILPERIEATKKDRYGAGIYNDRLFADASGVTGEKIKEAIKAAVMRVADIVAVNGQSPDPGFWKQFFRIEWVLKDLPSLDKGALISELSPFLDSSELATPFFQDDDSAAGDQFIELLDNVYKTKLANALYNAKGQYEYLMENSLFPSTSDIGTLELFQKKQSDYKRLYDNAYELVLANPKVGNVDKEPQSDKVVQQFYELLYSDNAFSDIASDYHKYFCIVYADADNIGATIKTLSDQKSYNNFSQKLGEYALNAAKTISDFGGKPVYIGGDDLLFFAPVCVKNEGHTKSIFHLIKKLDEQFGALNLEGGPTLSFGVTMTYYKFPLFEANQLCYEQLALHAKKVIWGKDKAKKENMKNAVAFRLLKHSGAFFEGILSKNMLKELVNHEAEIRQGDRNLLSSMVYKMETIKELLKQLDAGGTLTNQLPHLFDNFFNESIHKQNKEQVEAIQNLLKLTYETGFTVKGTDFDQNKNLYSILRVLKFITDKPAGKSKKAKDTFTANTAL